MPGMTSHDHLHDRPAQQGRPPSHGRRDQVDYRMPTLLLVAATIGAVVLSQV